MDAEEALRLGIVQRVLPDTEALFATTQAVMEKIASYPVPAVMFARESIRTHGDGGTMAAAEVADDRRHILLSMEQETRERHQAWRDAR